MRYKGTTKIAHMQIFLRFFCVSRFFIVPLQHDW